MVYTGYALASSIESVVVLMWKKMVRQGSAERQVVQPPTQSKLRSSVHCIVEVPQQNHSMAFGLPRHIPFVKYVKKVVTGGRDSTLPKSRKQITLLMT